MQDLSIGLEEELFVVEAKSRELVAALPEGFLAQCQREYPEQITCEFLQSQVEIITKPHHDLVALANDYWALRQCVIKIAKQYGLAVIASSSHPLSDWRKQTPTDHPRYQRLADKLQVTARRLLAAGMHLHLGIADIEKRFALFNQLTWYLPHFLALSGSSPFWCGRDTGLNSYRLSVIDSLPRTNLPPMSFTDLHHYRQYLDAICKAKIVEDAREIWWDARMSAHFPTVEMRIMDVCSNINDALAIAALYRCLMHYFYHDNNSALNRDKAAAYLLTLENRWVAQRYPLDDAMFIDVEEDRQVRVKAIVEKMLSVLTAHATQLGCDAQLAGIRDILSRGTSSQLQRSIYLAAKAEGATEYEALCAVVDALIAQTQLPPKGIGD